MKEPLLQTVGKMVLDHYKKRVSSIDCNEGDTVRNGVRKGGGRDGFAMRKLVFG